LSIDYASLQKTAANLLKNAGMPIVILRPDGTAGVYDPVTGTYAATGSDTSYTVSGVVVGVTVGYAMANAGNIEARDRLVYVSAGGVVPVPTDRVRIDGAAWGIVKIDTIAPAGIPVLYTLQVRP
jgi:hypothetical protein